MAGTLLGALVVLLVHNTAEVPDTTLAAAEAHVVRIYAEAGMTVDWIPTEGRRDFTIHMMLRRQPGGGPGAASPSALGTTLGDDHSHGASSFVFYARVLTLAHRYQQPVQIILAYAIAHEMGHVLLPAPAHASAGLMKPDWDGDDIRRLTTGEPLFTRDQAEAMRRTVDGYRLNAAK